MHKRIRRNNFRSSVRPTVRFVVAVAVAVACKIQLLFDPLGERASERAERRQLHVVVRVPHLLLFVRRPLFTLFPSVRASVRPFLPFGYLTPAAVLLPILSASAVRVKLNSPLLYSVSFFESDVARQNPYASSTVLPYK